MHMLICIVENKKWKRLDQPRQAQDAPSKKAFFAFLLGVACDLGIIELYYSLEGLGAGTGLKLCKR
jgi:hypothetical protein